MSWHAWCSGVGLCVVVMGSSFAADLSVQVVTQEGKPIPEAVVWVTPNNRQNLPKPAVMDQIHKTFVPYILPVQVGTTVDFPNSDSINHHVYSFSPAKRFELKLFPKEHNSHSVVFDKAGIVTLGCNIHDWMLAYVVVLETPWFAQTDEQGWAKLSIPDHLQGMVQIWHPQLADEPKQLTMPLTSLQWVMRSTQPLKPDLRRRPHGYD